MPPAATGSDAAMKLPRWNGSTSPATHLFTLVCFVLGFAAVTILSFGRITHDDREGPGWNPVSRMPDGKIGFLGFAIDCIGFVLLLLGFAVLAALTRR
jgi:hypothetical protein